MAEGEPGMAGVKIGVGIITSGVRPLRNEYSSLAQSGSIIHIHVDKDRKGGAYCRNQVIKSLYDAGCTHLFLFDDDVWPTREEWQTKFIQFAERRNLHFIGTPWPEGELIACKAGAVRTGAMTTQFAFLTRHCIERVGYFDERYGSYGPEDVDYAWRSSRLGMTGGDGSYLFPLWFNVFIHVEDFYSCFTRSTFPDDVKDAGIKATEDIFSQKQKAGLAEYIPYGNGMNNAT